MPGSVGVGWIEHANKAFGLHLPRERAEMVSRVECVEADRIIGARGPEPQRVDALAAPANDRRIDGECFDRFAGLPMGNAGAVGLDMAAKTNPIGAFTAFEFPWIAMREPSLGKLDLPALVDALAEHAVHIADSIAISGQVERRQALHEAGGKPAEPAIAKRRIGLDFLNRDQINPERSKRSAHFRILPEIGDGIAQQPPDQKLKAQIINTLGASGMRGACRFHPAVDDVVADCEDRRGEPVVGLGGLRVLADAMRKRIEDAQGQRGFGGAGFGAFGHDVAGSCLD